MLALLQENLVVRMLLFVLLFAAVSATVYIIMQAVAARQAARQRLLEPTVTEGAAMGGSLRSERAESNWLKLVNTIEKTGLNLIDTKDDSVRRLLIAAGFPQSHAPRVYTLVRLTMVIALPVLALTFFWLTGSRPSITRLYFTLVIAAALGLYIPNIYIRSRAANHEREIVNGFPDALDLLLVCVEAGLGLEAAFARVGLEMTTSHPRLAEQFGAVVLELRAGRTHEDALRRMADRAGAEEVRAFATLLIQSTKLGSSIAQTLRVYASEMRERRRLRAEEKAHRLPVLLSIPLVGCMLPVMVGVLMLPAAIRVVRTVLPALNGG